ncbi:MAG: extracellular solute-binding protein [Rhodobacteraceae bacterium]|nr:extracellular solute-binding protein [Paracoccaceae bacterium]
MAHPTRRTILTTGAAALAAPALLLSGRRAAAAGQVTVLNWAGYGTDEAWAIEAFREATGFEVVHDYFSSEAEMLTKLRTNPGAYDLVAMNSARFPEAIADGLLQAVDLSAVPNAAEIDPQLQKLADFGQDGTNYAVPWVWGMTAIAAREGLTPAVDSYAVFADPAYANRTAFNDDPVIAIGVGALLTGQDMNDPADFDAVAGVLKSFKPNIRLLWQSEDQWNKSFAAGEFDVGIYWSGSTVRSKRNSGLPVEFIVPKEGAIGWVDGLAMPAGAPNPEAALRFADWMVDPDFYLRWATEVGAPASANARAIAALPADDLSRKVHDPAHLATISFMAALPDERRQRFSDVWQEVKAHYAL